MASRTLSQRVALLFLICIICVSCFCCLEEFIAMGFVWRRFLVGSEQPDFLDCKEEFVWLGRFHVPRPSNSCRRWHSWAILWVLKRGWICPNPTEGSEVDLRERKMCRGHGPASGGWGNEGAGGWGWWWPSVVSSWEVSCCETG